MPLPPLATATMVALAVVPQKPGVLETVVTVTAVFTIWSVEVAAALQLLPSVTFKVYLYVPVAVGTAVVVVPLAGTKPPPVDGAALHTYVKADVPPVRVAAKLMVLPTQ